jgi:hypothetical protein
MTLKELEAGLPNGFHDALVHAYELNFESRTAVMEVSLWTGDPRDRRDAERERHARFRLVLHGVRFFHMEPPAPGYPYAAARPLRVDLYEADRKHPLLPDQPANVFAARFFLEEWNCFLHLAAEDAELVPPALGAA